MPATKRATIYFDPKLHSELRRRAAESAVSISEYVNDAVREHLREDYDVDLEELERRRREPSIDFDEYVRDLKRRGKL